MRRVAVVKDGYNFIYSHMEDVVKITKTGTTVVSESTPGSFGVVYISQLAAGINETAFNFYEGSVWVDDRLTCTHYDFTEFDTENRIITAHNVKMAL